MFMICPLRANCPVGLMVYPLFSGKSAPHKTPRFAFAMFEGLVPAGPALLRVPPGGWAVPIPSELVYCDVSKIRMRFILDCAFFSQKNIEDNTIQDPNTLVRSCQSCDFRPNRYLPCGVQK